MPKTVSSKAAPKQDTKLVLIEAGINIMMEKGYSNTGIQEVLSSVGVPKGSFYHYFDSKEDFACKIIEHFDQSYSSRILASLRDSSMTPLERLKNYCNTSKEHLLAQECRKGCLIGNLSQEMADQSETLRLCLSQVMGKWRDIFAGCIEEAQKNGQISKTHAPSAMAELFLSGWEGAVMRAKTTKSVEPLDVFTEVFFAQILK
ncbi:MAG: TetR/AcrR family transcriptional regulator [Candidatus Obscuribacterales bacterium]|nr:TetR/AcrR family transcriptional regulator [Candidatus Obscuribacterales bacterium]